MPWRDGARGAAALEIAAVSAPSQQGPDFTGHLAGVVGDLDPPIPQRAHPFQDAGVIPGIVTVPGIGVVGHPI
jgi:hypothetical protein